MRKNMGKDGLMKKVPFLSEHIDIISFFSIKVKRRKGRSAFHPFNFSLRKDKKPLFF